MTNEFGHPPWVVEAQEFIDREWRRHVHETEHVLLPDWKGERFALTSWTGVQQVHCQSCRYCNGDGESFESRLLNDTRASLRNPGSATAIIPFDLVLGPVPGS